MDFILGIADLTGKVIRLHSSSFYRSVFTCKDVLKICIIIAKVLVIDSSIIVIEQHILYYCPMTVMGRSIAKIF